MYIKCRGQTGRRRKGDQSESDTCTKQKLVTQRVVLGFVGLFTLVGLEDESFENFTNLSYNICAHIHSIARTSSGSRRKLSAQSFELSPSRFPCDKRIKL
jgi:hypothetical protein